MDYHGGERRPPRAARPQSTQPPYPDQQSHSRPQFLPSDGSRGNVSFQNTERGERHSPIDQQRQRTFPSAYQQNVPADVEALDYGTESRVLRKKSLVRPDREKIEPGHRQWHYRSHAQKLEDEGTGRVGVHASSEQSPPRCPSGTHIFQLLEIIHKPICVAESHSLVVTKTFTNPAFHYSSEVPRYGVSVRQHRHPRLQCCRKPRTRTVQAVSVTLPQVRKARGWCTVTC